MLKSAAAQAKQQLFVKNVYTQQLIAELERILRQPQADRDTWIKDHSESLADLVADYLEDSLNTLHSITLDAESLKLSEEYLYNLHQASSLMRSVVSRQRLPID